MTIERIPRGCMSLCLQTRRSHPQRSQYFDAGKLSVLLGRELSIVVRGLVGSLYIVRANI